MRAQAPAAKAPVRAEASRAARSRLVVEPLDLWLDSPVPLRATPELSAMPSEEMSEQRAQAIALWKALNAQPDELRKDGERLKALEAEAAAARAQAEKDRAAAAQLQQQLVVVEEERFPASIVYALGALVLLALLVAAWMWVRLRNASAQALRAWGDSVALGRNTVPTPEEEALGLAPHPGDTWAPPDTHPAPEDTPAAKAPAPVAVGAPAPVVAAPASRPTVSAVAAVPVPKKPAVVAPLPSLHIANPEELFDIQQQAEFFVSVGEHQQAIEVLKSYIAEHRETSPLAYLELMRLYHALGRVEEFAQLRVQFMQSFNAQVPDFSGFHRAGRVLYYYTDALADIEAEWTSPMVLPLLERLLFRRPGDEEAVEPFDMAAYDDLLLLLAIAQTTPASARGEPPPRKRTTPLLPPAEAMVAAAVPLAPPTAPKQDEQYLDSLAASLEFDFDLAPSRPAPAAPVTTAPAAINPDSTRSPLDFDLDLDLSQPLPLTLSDLPPVPVTPPPPSGQPVGFGMENDLMELRLELEQMKDKSDRSK